MGRHLLYVPLMIDRELEKERLTECLIWLHGMLEVRFPDEKAEILALVEDILAEVRRPDLRLVK